MTWQISDNPNDQKNHHGNLWDEQDIENAEVLNFCEEHGEPYEDGEGAECPICAAERAEHEMETDR